LRQAIALAFNPRVYHAEQWQNRVKQASMKAPEKSKAGPAAEIETLITDWNRRSEADSEGALAFYAFKKGLGADLPGRLSHHPI